MYISDPSVCVPHRPNLNGRVSGRTNECHVEGEARSIHPHGRVRKDLLIESNLERKLKSDVYLNNAEAFSSRDVVDVLEQQARQQLIKYSTVFPKYCTVITGGKSKRTQWILIQREQTNQLWKAAGTME